MTKSGSTNHTTWILDGHLMCEIHAYSFCVHANFGMTFFLRDNWGRGGGYSSVECSTASVAVSAAGIMRVEDLSHVFKASPALGGGEEARSLGASLLNKFELALCWDARQLLVPPLLPDREPRVPQVSQLERGQGAARPSGEPARAKTVVVLAYFILQDDRSGIIPERRACQLFGA